MLNPYNEVVQQNIELHQDSLTNHLLGNRIMFNLLIDEEAEYHKLEESIAQGMPVILALGNFSTQHAVVAYGIVKEGDIAYILVYDNELPFQADADISPTAFPYATYDLISHEFNYSYVGTVRFLVQEAEGEIITLGEALATSPTLFWVKCPVNVSVEDQIGRIVNSQGTNEIPGAYAEVIGERQIFYLPGDLSYTVSLEGSDYGEATVALGRLVGEDDALITAFFGVQVTPVTRASLLIQPGVLDCQMEVDIDGDGNIDEEASPDVNQTLSGNSLSQAEANGSYVCDEGSVVMSDGSGSSDLDNDTIQYRWDFDNDGEWDTEWSSDPTASYTWGDDHSGVVRLGVSDGQLVSIDTAEVTVTNIPPQVEAGPDQMAECGIDEVTFTGGFIDPGWLDTHTIEWDFGDGVTVTGVL